ncbi:hypothetical protein KCU91_g13956, partial [Aureobasidium melanogenum]
MDSTFFPHMKPIHGTSEAVAVSSYDTLLSVYTSSNSLWESERCYVIAGVAGALSFGHHRRVETQLPHPQAPILLPSSQRRQLFLPQQIKSSTLRTARPLEKAPPELSWASSDSEHLRARAMLCDSSISDRHSRSARPCVPALAFARSFLFNMACLCLLHQTAQRSLGTPSLLFRDDAQASYRVFMRACGSQVSALVTPVCFTQQPWLQDILHECICSEDQNSLENNLDNIIIDEQRESVQASNMSFPASKSTITKCTTMSDIVRALDETHDRIASMGADELKRERVDSVNSLKAVDHPKWLKPIKAFDQKKYLGDLESADITLRQIKSPQTQPSCLRSTSQITPVSTALPKPMYGPGKCTYDAYPLPPKRKRDAVSDTIEDALKKVKRVGGRGEDEAIASLFLAVNHSWACFQRPNILRSHSVLLNRMKENKAMTISRLNNEQY